MVNLRIIFLLGGKHNSTFIPETMEKIDLTLENCLLSNTAQCYTCLNMLSMPHIYMVGIIILTWGNEAHRS